VLLGEKNLYWGSHYSDVIVINDEGIRTTKEYGKALPKKSVSIFPDINGIVSV